MLIIWLPEKNSQRPEKKYRKNRDFCYINGDSGQWHISGMFLNVVFAYCTSEQLAKVPDTAVSMLHSSPNPHLLEGQPSFIGLSHHCWISFQAAKTFTNLVLYHMWVCSIILKPTLHVFMLSSHLTLRLLMSYIYGAPILDVSRSQTTTQHSR